MEWLEGNLGLAYPFTDDVSGDTVGVFADAQVNCHQPGPYVLTTFDPQTLTDAIVVIKDSTSTTTLLSTTVATATTLGDYTVLAGTDGTRGSSFRFILDTAALGLFPPLASPVTFAVSACNFIDTRLTSLQGLTDDVILDFPDYVQLQITDNQVTIAAQDPEDRVDCSTVDCDLVFQVGSASPDRNGSLALLNDGCHRLVPHPTDPAKLLIYNHCAPCLDCDDIDTLNSVFATQTSYYHQLSAIYHDQFNRYQVSVAGANLQIANAAARSALATSTGLFNVAGRAFNRPYFSQLALALTNSTLYQVQVVLTVTITPSGISDQLTYVAGSGTIQRFLQTGEQIDTFGGFPGVYTVTMEPQETLSLSSEVHRSTVDTSVTSGLWNVSAALTYLAGPGTLPDPIVVPRTFAIELIGAEPTTGP